MEIPRCGPRESRAWRNGAARGARRALLGRVLRIESLECRAMMTTLSWVGGVSNTIDTTSLNWSDGTNTVAWQNGDTMVLGGTGAALTIAPGAAISAAEIDFTGSGYNIGADTDGSLAVSGSGTIDVASGITDTISAPLVGSNGLTLPGSGTLLLSGENSFTGATVIAAGTLKLGNALALRSSTSVSCLAAGTLDLNGQTIGSAVPLDDFAGTLTNTDTGVPASFDATINATTQDSFTVAGSGNIALNAPITGSSDTILTKSGDNILTLADPSEFNSLSIDVTGGSVVQSGSATYTTLDVGAGSTMTIAPSGTISTVTTLYWDPGHTGSTTGPSGGDGAWDTTAENWYNEATNADQAWSNSGFDTAIFSGSAGTVSLDTGIAADEVSFQTDGYMLQDGTLATSGYGISVAADVNVTLNSTFDSSTGLIKTGTGNLNLGGSNTYTGTTLILYGMLTVANPEALGDSSGVGSRPSATLDLNGESIDDSVPLVFFEGTLTNNGADAATFAGLVNYDPFGISPNFTVSGTGDITLSGAVDEYGWGALTKTGDNTLILSGSDNNIGLDMVVDSGIVQLDKSSSSSIHAIEDSLTINDGTVQITGSGGDQIENGSTVIVGGGTLDLNGIDETVDSLSGTGDILVTGSGVLTVGGASTNVGTTTIDTGSTVEAGAAGAFSADSDFVVNGTLDLNGNDESIGSLAGNGVVTNFAASTTSVLMVGGDDGSTMFSGVLQNGGSTAKIALTKAGDGVLTLAGINTYTGDTNISDGTIELSGNNHQILNSAPSGYANGIVPADLSAAFNWTGITGDGDLFSGIDSIDSGGIDGSGNAISTTALGTSLTAGGVDFNFGPSESSDVIQATGQDVDLPQGQFSALKLLATSVNGDQTGLTFTVNYMDGSSDTFTQSISDWTTPESYSGESSALSMSYVNTASGGTLSGTYHIYEYSFDVDPSKTVLSITLPDSSSVIVLAVTGVAPTDVPTSLSATPIASDQIQLSWTAPSGAVTGYYVYRGQSTGGESTTPLNSTELAAGATSYVDTTVVPGNTYYYKIVAIQTGVATSPSNEVSCATPTAVPTTQVDLTSAYNLTGIVANGTTFSGSGGLDDAGTDLSGNLLGASQTSSNNVSFIIGQPGSDNVVQAAGQTIDLPSGEFTHLDILATAVGGDQAFQSFTVNYADGTSQTFSQTINDWTDSDSGSVAMAYSDLSDGTTGGPAVNLDTYVLDLASGETVGSITLPNNGGVFIVAMRLRTAELLPMNSNVQIADGALLDLNGTDQSLASLSGESGSTVVLGGAMLTIGSGDSSTTFSGAIYGSGSLEKVGTGALTLSGASAYTGPTIVSAGTLAAGVTDVFSPNSSYAVTGTGILDVGGFDQSIGSLSGNGEVTNGSGTAATLSLGGDNTDTAFCGTIENGDSQLSLNKSGSGTFILSGPNKYNGPTTIIAGTLEVDDYVNYSPVTIDSGATLTGDGGTGPVANLGGSSDATLYKVTVLNTALQDADGDAPGDVTLGYATGEGELVMAQSAADAAYQALQVTGSSDIFTYVPDFSLGSYSGQAFVDGVPGGDHSADPDLTISGSDAGDYFPICVVQDTSDPIAAADSYKDGVGGELTKDSTPGVLHNDTDQSSGTSLSIYSHTDPANGTLALSSDGSFTYTPNSGFFGTDTFSYVATDGTHQSNSATVTINVLLPQIDLLDDANNDGSVNSADKAVKDTDPGAIVLLSDDATDPTSNANADHLADIQIKIDPNDVFASIPYDLTGWKLNLDATGADGSIDLWDTLGKSTELDNAGAGDETWTFGSSLSSAGVPSDLYADVNNDPSTGTLVAQLEAPSGTTPPTSPPAQSVKVTGQAGTLTADTVNETSGVIAASPALPHGQTAVIPVDNIDQWYNDKKITPFNGDPSPVDTQGYYTDVDLESNGGPTDVPHDEYLLPVVVTGALGDTYSLEIPSNVRAWASDDRTVQITSGEALDMSGGTVTIYVQGIADGTGTLHLDWTHGGVTTDAIDSLPITTFEFQGQANVPNFSTYDYEAVGAPVTALTGESQWSLPDDFSGATIANSFANGQGATIQWGYGGLEQRWADFTVNQYYTWDYNVNVVQIDIGPPTNSSGGDTAAFSVNQSTAQLPGSDGTNLQGIQYGVNQLNATGVVISSAPKGSNAITWGAGITMAGPEGYWGVDRMIVGFTQVVTSISYVATYANSAALSATLNTATPLHDTDNGSLPGIHYWYGAVPPTRPNIIIGSSSTGLNVIGSSDAPRVAIPAYVDKALDPGAGDSALASVNLSIGFQLYVSAGIFDGNPTDKIPVGNVYTELAMAPPMLGSTNSWGWTTSGTFNGSFQYAATASNLQGPANSQWSQRARGSILSNAYGQGNIAFADNDWR